MASTGARPGSGRFLPPDPRVEGPYRFTPQLALRLGILGAVALLAFGVLFFRLWSLQVLSGTQFLQAAQNNQLRLLPIEAPRGPIKDRRGRLLVDALPATVALNLLLTFPVFALIRRLFAQPHRPPEVEFVG